MKNKTEELAKKLKVEYEAGESLRQLARKHGISHNYVWLLLGKAGTTMRRREVIPTEKLRKMRDTGMSYRAISEETGLSKTAVHNRLKAQQKQIGSADEFKTLVTETCSVLCEHPEIKKADDYENTSFRCNELRLVFSLDLYHPLFHASGGRTIVISLEDEWNLPLRSIKVSSYRTPAAIASDIKSRLLEE